MPTPNKPSTNIQWNAIQNGANSNSLLSKLFAGKPSVTKAPPVVAASSQVKGVNAPPTSPSPTFALGNGQGSIIPTSSPTPQTPTPPPTTGNTTTPSGAVVNATTGQAVSTPTPSSTFGGLIGGITSVARGNEAIGQSAADIAAKYGKQIADVGQQGAMGEAGQTTTGTTPVAEGNAAVTQQTTAARQAALAAGESAALQGTAQKLTAQNQEANALQGAASATQPSVTGFGQTVFDPATGQFEGGGGPSTLNPLNNIDSIAQQVISGQISPQQAYQMGGSVQNFQGALNAAILAKNPNFNIANAQGAFDARQQNTTTAGTAPTNAYSATYQANYPQYVSTQQALSNVEGIGSLLLSTAQGGQVNPFAPQFANQTLAQFRSQLSAPDQSRFNSTLAAFQGAASQLLTNSSGQIPTDVSNNISAIANGSLSLAALKAMVDQAKQEGTIKLQSAAAAVNTPGSGIGAPQVGGGNTLPQSNNNPLGI